MPACCCLPIRKRLGLFGRGLANFGFASQFASRRIRTSVRANEAFRSMLMMQRLADTTVLMTFSLVYRVAVLMLKRRKVG